MLVHRGERLVGKVLGNFLHAGRIAPGLNMAFEVGQNFLLAFSKMHGRPILPREGGVGGTKWIP